MSTVESPVVTESNGAPAQVSKIVGQLKHARRVSTPLVAITTSDPGATMRDVVTNLNGGGDTPEPKISWDIARGFVGQNEAGRSYVASMGEAAGCMNPFVALKLANEMPPRTILFYLNAHRFIKDTQVMQAIWNLRDPFKRTTRMLLMLGVSIDVPIELTSDVVVFDEPYPDDKQLQATVRNVIKCAGESIQFAPTDEIIARTAANLKGTSNYGAEQLSAMALRKAGFDAEYLRAQAATMIEQTKGLVFEPGRETFASMGGLDFAKEWGTKLFNGPEPPAVVVRVEELEKAMAGTKGDLSGTSMDTLQVMLTEMEDNEWGGLLAFGAPGAGKSLYSKALANTFGAIAMRFDINACKGSLVGQSEQQIRQAMKVIKTIGGPRVFFIASMNSMDVPPPLQRRFTSGVWFFDVLDAKERPGVWAINKRRFNIPDEDRIVDDTDLTGADIRNLCAMAYRLGCTLTEAQRYVVPLKVQSPAAIKDAREQAHGHFISASHGGTYEMPSKRSLTNKSDRKLAVE